MPRPPVLCRLVTTTTTATATSTATAATAARWCHWGVDVLAFMLLAVASSVAWPQATVHAPQGATVHYREGQRIDPQQVRKILSTDAPAPGRTRSIRLLDGDAAASPLPGSEEHAPASALSAPVQFEFDSTVILPEARGQLDAIAEGIKLLPPGRQVVIEGHTDAAGSDDSNQQLSRRRAAAVKQYLAQRHGIAPQRLREMGLGERQPIDGLDPFAPDNRRVQFRGG
jgi:outer membrane protein OmpA-like peptidoglycan-associated protein